MPEIGEVRKAKEIGRKDGHKYIWHACIGCGKQRWVALIQGMPISLSCVSCGIQHGKKHWRWNGGKTKRSDGYIEVWLSPDDFYHAMTYDGQNRRHYVPEHRLVMARHLGRCLLPWEVVHHRGTKYPLGSIEDKGDNRIENLELLPHGRFHLVDMRVKGYIKNLENKIKVLEQENQRLKAKISCPLNLPNCKNTCPYLKGNGGGTKLCDWPYRYDLTLQGARYMTELLKTIEGEASGMSVERHYEDRG